MEFLVKFTWHDDENIWLATLTGAHSLVVDCNSFDGLLEKVKFIMQDVAENDFKYSGEVKLRLEIDHTVSMNVMSNMAGVAVG